MTRRTILGGAAMAVAAEWLNAQQAEARGEGPKVTRYVCEFAAKTKFEDLPADVIELGKKSILDGIGLAFSGSVARTGPISRDYVEALGAARRESTVIGTAMKSPARFAAFLNGVAMHADDYDDTQLAVAKNRVYGLLTHPTVTAWAPALAVGEAGGRSGRDVMLAYHVGVEVESKIAEAINPRHYVEGFHSTGPIGVFGSAAAVAKLRGYDAGQTARALGIAGAQSSGLRENFGTMTKPFQAGHAAESGVLAADLAERGWTAAENILEAPVGFFRAAGGGFDIHAIYEKLGRPWTFHDPGVSIKPYPSGSLTHPGMTEMLRLIREHDIKPEQVESVEVGTNSYMPTALIHHHPQNALEAKFSMEFCMAALLLYRKAGLTVFVDEVVRRPDVQAMMGRVKFGVNAEADAAGSDKMTTVLTLHLKDGRAISGRADFGKGSPANPMSYAEVSEKFLDCAEFAKWPKQKAAAVVEMVGKLETLPDIRELTKLCAA
jgi:2-methylcitrate dehydratase PrpD